jgi:arabinose-5-phosphate isomerase
MNDLFVEQQSLINYFFSNLDYSKLNNFVNKLTSVNGLVLISGVGKSGFVAQNISQMLVSTGIRAMFLDPVNALHGDVGIISQNDLVLFFSRSGQTSELINLLPAIRNKKAYCIAIVSNTESTLAKICDEYIHLPLEKELCPFDLAPTTSSIIQLIFGNTIVAHLMQKNGLTKEQYAANHPAGRIGKRLTVKVEDVMRKHDLPICHATDKLIDNISLMSSKRCGCLLICDTNDTIDNKKKLIGIFTDGDLRRALELNGANALDQPLANLMIPNPNTTQKEIMAFDAMQSMEAINDTTGKKRVSVLPVINDKGIIEGLISLHDLVAYGL